ncbi:MAG: PKD domain-containing protein [Vicingaceae bacterium]|nr:PKD domain-containing protein [Vicingaceae bacterium]
MKKITLLLALFISFCNLIYSQFPGGVSAASTNKIWLDASQMSANNGQPILSWTDFSGNNTDANQVIVSKSPTYKTNSINGRPALDFDGVDDYIFISANSALNSNQSTHFIVYEKSTVNSGINMLFNMSFNEASNLLFSYATPTYNASYIKNSSGSPRYSTYGNPSSNLIASHLWNGNTGSYEGYVNGSAGNFASGATNTATGHNITRIGAFNTNYRFNGDIAEIVYYTSVLNSAEQNIVENYLGAKYQISVANDFYTHESTHGDDVIGIGQEADGNNLLASGITNIDLSASSMNNGDYVFVGHDDGGFGNNTSDVPSGYSRYNQVWRSTLTNYAGTVDISFDVSVLGLGNDTSYKLLVDADGVFATGATEYAGAFSNGVVTFTGVTLTNTSFFTLSNSDFSVISTGVTNDWHLTTTWNCGCIPSLGSDVNILSGHNVFINGQNAQAGNLTIDGSLSFNNDDTLQINQNLTNNGTLTAGIGTFNFNGVSFAHNVAGTVQFYNLIINNSLGLTLNGNTDVQGWLDIVSGTITTNNNLTLLSNNSGTAAVYRPKSSEFSGDITVERFLNEGESYYLLAPVVSNGNLEDWNQEAEMQGFTGTEWPGGISSVYFYDQNNNVTSYYDGYTVPNSTFDVIDPKVGYEIYVGDDTKATGARTIDITGSPTFSNVVYSAPHIANIGNPADDGWSLITNPYPSPVKWGNVIRTGSFDAAYVKRVTGAYVSINNQWVLGSGEAFWVHSNAGGSSIDFRVWMAGHEKDITDTYNLKTITNQDNTVMDIRLSYNYNNVSEEDVAYLGFSSNATDNKDDNIDTYKLNNIYSNKPNLSTINNGVEMERNTLSINNSSIVPLSIVIEYPSTTLLNYTLHFDKVNDLLMNNKKVILEDRKLSIFTDLTQDTSYSFSMMDTVTQPRFFLHLSSPIASVKSDVTCYGANNGKIVANAYGNDLKNYVWKDDLNNTIAFTSNSISADSIQNLIPGTYTVEITNNNSLETIINTYVINEPSEISSNFFTITDANGDANIVSTTINDTINANVGQSISFQNSSENALNYSWDFGDLTGSTIESPNHTYFNVGMYKVELTSGSNTCNKASQQYVNVINTTGIVENNYSFNFNVFNTGNNLNISFDDSFDGNAMINITNSIGQIIYSASHLIEKNGTESIYLNNASGVYYVNVESGKVSKTKKIVFSKK